MNKILNRLQSILLWCSVLFALFIMLFTVATVYILDSQERNILGVRLFVVQSNSMQKTDFEAGDVVISIMVDPLTLKAGDIISFISENSENYGKIVTHKIRKVVELNDGSVGFITYGTTSNSNDETLATKIIGKYFGRIPKLGFFCAFFRKPIGYLTCIFLPYMFLMVSQALDIYTQYQYHNNIIEEETNRTENEQKARKIEKSIEIVPPVRYDIYGRRIPSVYVNITVKENPYSDNPNKLMTRIDIKERSGAVLSLRINENVDGDRESVNSCITGNSALHS